MKTSLVVAAIVVGCVLPASAEHLTHVDPSSGALTGGETGTRTLDIDIELGANAFRIGGRWFGDKGVSGAWLNGQVRPDGFAIDGRVQSDAGRAYNFKIDADVMDFVTRTAWWMLRRPIAD
jgi:hypothetical protein